MVPLRWSPQKIYPILHLTSRGYLKWVYPQVYHPHMSKRTPTRVGLNKQLRGMEPTIPRGAPFSQHFSGPAFWISKWNLSTNTGNSGGCGISCRTEGRIFWEKHMAVFLFETTTTYGKKTYGNPRKLECWNVVWLYFIIIILIFRIIWYFLCPFWIGQKKPSIDLSSHKCVHWIFRTSLRPEAPWILRKVRFWKNSRKTIGKPMVFPGWVVEFQPKPSEKYYIVKMGKLPQINRGEHKEMIWVATT